MDLDFNQPQGNTGQSPVLPTPGNTPSATPQPMPTPQPKPEPMTAPQNFTPKPTAPVNLSPEPKSPVAQPKPLVTEPKNASHSSPEKPKTNKKSSGHSIARWLIIVIVLLVIAILGVGSWMILSSQDAGTSATSDLTYTDDATLGVSDAPVVEPGFDSTVSSGTEVASTDNVQTADSRDDQRKADLANIKAYLDGYYAENGSYPVADTVTKINNSDSVLVSALIPKYANELPSDPSSPDYWYGYKSSGGTSFELTARLENTEDPAGSMEGSVFLYRVTSN